MIDLIFSDVPLDTFRTSSMHPIHQAKLRKNRRDLVRDLNATDITDHLMSKGIISSEEKDIILSPGIREQQNRKLLDTLPTKGPRAYVEFTDALDELSDWLVDALNSTIIGVEDMGFLTQQENPMQNLPTVQNDTRMASVQNTQSQFQQPAPHEAVSYKALESDSVPVLNFEHGIVMQYDLQNRCWGTLSSIPEKVIHMNKLYRACASGDGKVYVLDTKSMHLSCFDVGTRRWEDLDIRIDTTRGVKFAAVAYVNGKLYLSGRDSIESDKRCNTMTSLTLHGQNKSPISVQEQPSMIYARSYHTMAICGDKLIVCGGLGAKGLRLTKCEGFDLAVRQWSSLADMPEACWSLGLIPELHVGTNTFAVGGSTRFTADDKSATLSDTAAVYDGDGNRWKRLPLLPMPVCNAQGIYWGSSLWLLAAVIRKSRDPDNRHKTITEPLGCVLEFKVYQQRWITHHSVLGCGTDGSNAYVGQLPD